MTTAVTQSVRQIRALLLAAMFASCLFLMASCHTVEGAGKDIEDAGEGIQDAAD